MQNAYTRKTAYMFFFNFTTDLQRKPNRPVFQNRTEPAIFLKTEPNLKNPFRTSLLSYLLKMLMVREIHKPGDGL